jgi:hypothetical protein
MHVRYDDAGPGTLVVSQAAGKDCLIRSESSAIKPGSNGTCGRRKFFTSIG